MANTNKGNATQNKIVACARALFYEKGYHETSMRMISDVAGTNVGLINYYFKSKARIAMLIYSDIRHRFDQMMFQFENQLSKEDVFLLSSAIEMRIALDSEPYADFYVALSREAEFRANIRETISQIVELHADSYADMDIAKLNIVSTLSMKPTLVREAWIKNHSIPKDTVIEYYMRMQLHMLAMPEEHCHELIAILNRYQLQLTDGFTPILSLKL